ncbi:MAG: response regulator, partial [Deltaproteobacteria bacterium]|nr:response regulator [Deltaproteobacteria bacterium]
MFVDDELSILKALKRLFRDEPYEILISTSPTQAMQLLQDQEVPVVVSDQRMPEMEKVKENWPDTVRMVLTGYADLEAALAAINQGNVYRFINKPWDEADLRLAVKNALTHYQLIAENRQLFELTKKQNLILTDLNLNLEKKVRERTEQVRGLLEQLEKSFQQLIRVFIELMELYNPSLGGHAKRVEKEEGTHSKAELALIRQHPTLGHMILNKIDDLKQAAAIVRAHHENFDGTGYPDGLRGERIPLVAQIVRIADDYDNLINRKNLSRSDALETLKRKSGSDYDPQIIFQLLNVFEELEP